MNLFYNLLLEYLEFLKLITFDCLGTNKVEKHKTNELYELFKTNKDYMWVIFDILLSNKNTDVVNIHEIYKKYNLTYNDLLKIVDLLRLYSFFELSLGLELLPIYKYKEVEEKYQEFIIQNKEQLIKGEGYGQ